MCFILVTSCPLEYKPEGLRFTLELQLWNLEEQPGVIATCNIVYSVTFKDASALPLNLTLALYI